MLNFTFQEIINKMKLNLTFFLLIICNISIAQKSNLDSISVSAYWAIGDKVAYKTLEKNTTIVDQVISENKEKFVFISFEVLDSSSDNYILKYTKDSIQIPGIDLTGINKQVNDIISSLAYKFRTDSYGEYVSLENWEEVRDNSLKMMDDLIKSLTNEEEIETYKKIQKGLKNAFQNKKLIEHSMLKDIGSIFYNYGYIYALNDTLKYEEELPNVIGKGTIPAKGTFVVALDQIKNEIIFKTTTTIDNEVGKKYIIEASKSMYETMDFDDKPVDLNKIFKDAKLDIQIVSEVKYDIETGWMKESYQLRKIVVNDSKEETIRTEEIKMTQMR